MDFHSYAQQVDQLTTLIGTDVKRASYLIQDVQEDFFDYLDGARLNPDGGCKAKAAIADSERASVKTGLAYDILEQMESALTALEAATASAFQLMASGAGAEGEGKGESPGITA